MACVSFTIKCVLLLHSLHSQLGGGGQGAKERVAPQAVLYSHSARKHTPVTVALL